MDHPWHPRPPIQGNICPTCSTSHFPFCPPQVNSRYPIDHARPNFDPNLTHPMSMNRAAYPNPGDPYNGGRYWDNNPSLGREAYGGQFQLQHHHQQQQQEVGDYTNVHSVGLALQNSIYNGNVGMENEYGGSDRTSKRLRVEGTQYGVYSSAVAANSSRVLSEENERRLKLIRDHGGALGGQFFSAPGTEYDSGGETRGYTQQSDLKDVGAWRQNNFVEVGFGEPYRRVEHQSDFGQQHTGNHRQHPYGERGKPSNLAAFGHVGGPGTEGGDIYSAHTNMGDSVGESRGYQHTTRRSFEYSRDFTPQHSEFGNWNDFHQRSNVVMESHSFVRKHSPTNPLQYHSQISYGYPSSHQGDARQQVEARPLTLEGYDGASVRQTSPVENQFGKSAAKKQGAYGPKQALRGYDPLLPFPSSPPRPIPANPGGHWSAEFKMSSSSPIGVTSDTQHSLRPCGPEFHSSAQPYFSNSQPMRASGSFIQGSGTQTSGKYFHEPFPPESNFLDKPKIVDASKLFRPPDRASRPDHFVVILRGLPGSGKSYLAKMLRDLEVDHGGDAPRIHSMDDYFMTEVEKVDENSASKPSARGRKPATKKVFEYCYEPEMLEAYRSSMLKAFKKTLEEGAFTFVIVDDRNLRVADFAQFWATAKRSGYEVYVLEAPYEDPMGCTARNVHGFSLGEIEKMAAQWEETPPLYLRLDVKSLFHGDDLTDNDIQEVDMDMEDNDGGELLKLEEKKPKKTLVPMAEGVHQNGSPEEEKKWSAEGDGSLQEVKDLGHSKWLGDLDDVDAEGTEVLKGKSNALSGLLQTYGKEGKSVHWGDEAIDAGFSIGALKKANMVSLVIGPGAGYNLKSNPLTGEDTPSSQTSGETKRRHIFEEQLRAERLSFKAVFDRRRHRIGGLDADDE
ncbi:hypothetical protein Dimus_004860 [Dionaea muscipula]